MGRPRHIVQLMSEKNRISENVRGLERRRPLTRRKKRASNKAETEEYSDRLQNFVI